MEILGVLLGGPDDGQLVTTRGHEVVWRSGPCEATAERILRGGMERRFCQHRPDVQRRVASLLDAVGVHSCFRVGGSAALNSTRVVEPAAGGPT